MHIPDLINGGFELFGSFAIWRNVTGLWKDKEVKGVRLAPMVFFTLWGFWNLYYYPHLDQLFSFSGGLSIVASNVVYVALMAYYIRRPGGVTSHDYQTIEPIDPHSRVGIALAYAKSRQKAARETFRDYQTEESRHREETDRRLFPKDYIPRHPAEDWVL